MLSPICKSILPQRFSCKNLGNQKPTANTVRSTRRTTLRWMRANFRSSNIFCICPSLFETPVLTRQNIAWSTKNFQEFLASQVSVLWEEIKPTTPLLLTVHFLAAMKPLVFRNLFKLFGLDITFAREVCRLRIKMKKILQSSLS